MPISRYPRKGHPLAPQLLEAYLRPKAPVSLVGGEEVRLYELDERSWSRYPHQKCFALAKKVLDSVSIRQVVIREECDIEFPRIASGVRIDDIELENRTYNALSREFGPRSELSELAGIPLGSFLEIRGLGIKSLVDLTTSVEHYQKNHLADDENVEPSQVTIELEEQYQAYTMAVSSFLESDIFVDLNERDIRYGRFLREYFGKATSLKNGLEQALTKKPSLVNPNRGLRIVHECHSQLSHAQNLSTVEELDEILESAGRIERNAIIYKFRMGWSGNLPQSLENISHIFEVSRERIRQICRKMDNTLRSFIIYAPRMARLIQKMPDATVFLPSEILEFADDKSITEENATGILAAACTFSKRDNQQEFLAFAKKKVLVLGPEVEFESAFNQVTGGLQRSFGVCSISATSNTLLDKYGIRATGLLIRRLVDMADSYHFVDPDQEWFVNINRLENRLTKRILKALCVVRNPISIRDLRRAIRRDWAMQGVVPHAQVLSEICLLLPDIQKVGSGLIMKSNLPVSHWLSSNELLLYRTLSRTGSPVQREDLFDECRLSGMKDSTISRYLSHCPIVERIGYQIWGLLGAKIDPAEVEAMQKEHPSSKSRTTSGWTPEGRLFVSYRLSKAHIEGSALGIPAAIANLVAGCSFELVNEENAIIGAFESFGQRWSSFARIFEAIDALPGDELILEIDLHNKTAFSRHVFA
jgi:hypothetical protein